MADLGSLIGGVLQNYANANVPQNPNEVANVPHDQVYNHYQQFAQQADPQQVYQAHQQAFQQIPQNQQGNLFNSLVGAVTQHGINPQQIGMQGKNPSPQNYAQVAQYVTQNPDLLQSVFGQGGALSSPLAKMALAGALAVAANNLTSRR